MKVMATKGTFCQDVMMMMMIMKYNNNGSIMGSYNHIPNSEIPLSYMMGSGVT
jgi:hypothetical protein